MSNGRTEIYNYKGNEYKIISCPQRYNDPKVKDWGACGEIVPSTENQRLWFSSAVEFFDSEKEACDFFIKWAKEYIHNNM